MNYLDALKSNSPFKRKGWDVWIYNLNGELFTMTIPNFPVELTIADQLAEDYIVQ